MLSICQILPTLPLSAVLPVGAPVCAQRYAKSVRHAFGKVKANAYAEHGIGLHRSDDFEDDHVISLELGGSNGSRDLWPERYWTEPWNAQRTRLEGTSFLRRQDAP